MGSKKLKAVVCRGSHTVSVREPETVTRINKAWREYADGPSAMPNMKGWSENGTAGNYESCVLMSDVGIKNWGGVPDELDFDTQVLPMTGKEMDKRIKTKKYGCNSCQIACGALYHIKDDKHDFKSARPEYETLGSFGSLLLNGDPVCVNVCNFLCNEYGYDTISLGNTLAWLMECYENGLFTIDELDGIDLRWGNAEAIIEMTRRICDYEGIGIALGGASVSAARELGRGEEYLCVANGIEIPHHCARNNPAMARTFQYDPTPGRHVKGGRGAGFGFGPPEVKYIFEGTGEADKAGTINAEYDNLSGFCHFCFFLQPGTKYEYMNAVTDYGYSDEEFKRIGLRSFAIRSAFNIRGGMSRMDYIISDRNIGIPPVMSGPLAGVTIPAEQLADNFFEAMGWHVETGVPTKEFLENVGGLEAVIRDMYP
jgi:aldehyde:ferredoxin oxidoreductase